MPELDAFYREVGRLVRCARTQAGLTQDLLAARVALSRTSVTNIEQGRQKVLLHTLRDIAAAVGIETSELLPKGPAESEPGQTAGDAEEQGDCRPKASRSGEGHRKSHGRAGRA